MRTLKKILIGAVSAALGILKAIYVLGAMFSHVIASNAEHAADDKTNIKTDRRDQVPTRRPSAAAGVAPAGRTLRLLGAVMGVAHFAS